jgi:hypothetical protein
MEALSTLGLVFEVLELEFNIDISKREIPAEKVSLLPADCVFSKMRDVLALKVVVIRELNVVPFGVVCTYMVGIESKSSGGVMGNPHPGETFFVFFFKKIISLTIPI